MDQSAVLYNRIAALHGIPSNFAPNMDALQYLLPAMMRSGGSFPTPTVSSFLPFERPYTSYHSTNLLHTPIFCEQQPFVKCEPKPSHSYIGLISMAILNSENKQLVLSDIYQWIVGSYVYFRTRGVGWKNSIRHNLSLNDCFIKSGRCPNGKGHYWTIHPANMDDFIKGDFRRRRAQQKVKRYTQQHKTSDTNYMSSSSSEDELMSPVSSCTNISNDFEQSAMFENLTEAKDLKVTKRPFDIESLLGINGPLSKKQKLTYITKPSSSVEFTDGGKTSAVVDGDGSTG